MAKCNFTLEFSGSPDELISRARGAIQNAGGIFNGNQASGAFELRSPVGTVKGNYSIQENAVQMLITEKPLFISCGRIEDELRKYLSR